MKAIGADWSDAFLNSLISPSVEGFAQSVAGNNVYMEMWECDRSMVPANTCNEALATQFPPSLTCEVQQSMSGFGVQAAANEVQKTGSTTVPVDIVEQLESQNYKLEPVGGHKNRWRILSIDEASE
eukprot:Clim_evm1s7 gene=Clim_evmTU1s7